MGLPLPRTATSRWSTWITRRPSCRSGLEAKVHWKAKGPRLRSQSFRPSTVKATSSPVPKKKTTVRPSVTGEGEQELLYWPSVENAEMSARQSTAPVRRSRQRAACWPEAASAAGRNTRSPQMTGVAAEGPGRVTAHFTFSVREKVAGRLVSGLEPLWAGPRQLSQLARAGTVATRARTASRVRRRGDEGIRGFLTTRNPEAPGGQAGRATSRPSPCPVAASRRPPRRRRPPPSEAGRPSRPGARRTGHESRRGRGRGRRVRPDRWSSS